MPEGPEIRIMSDFINQTTENKLFDCLYHVEKGNVPFIDDKFSEPFRIISKFHGKKLILELILEKYTIPIYVFMGMSGSWKWTKKEQWSDTKYTRLRFDTNDGHSLLLHGGYLGPKYSMYKNFKSSKNGPDIIQEFDKFITNIYQNIGNKDFRKPIYELLLDQKYFAGVGNYLRSTILFYSNDNPFISAKETIESNPKFLETCRDVLQKAYEFNGGQLKDWSNPFQKTSIVRIERFGMIPNGHKKTPDVGVFFISD